MRRREEFLIGGHTRNVPPLEEVGLRFGVLHHRRQERVTPAVRLESRKRGLDLGDGGDDGTPVGGCGFVQLSLGEGQLAFGRREPWNTGPSRFRLRFRNHWSTLNHSLVSVLWIPMNPWSDNLGKSSARRAPTEKRGPHPRAASPR